MANGAVHVRDANEMAGSLSRAVHATRQTPPREQAEPGRCTQQILQRHIHPTFVIGNSRAKLRVEKNGKRQGARASEEDFVLFVFVLAFCFFSSKTGFCFLEFLDFEPQKAFSVPNFPPASPAVGA